MVIPTVWSRVGWLSTLVTLIAGYGSQAALAANFRDTGNHWAQSYIDSLSSSGVISGFPDGTFRPNQPVTRAQFATIMNKAFQLSPAPGSVTFRDVPGNYWASNAIATAASNNWVAGFPDGSFRPEQPVTRTETWAVLANSIQGQTIPASQTNDLFNRYRDTAAIPTWATAKVAAASQAGLIVNYPDPMLLEPNRAATRAEVAAFTFQALAQRNSPNTVGLGGGGFAPVNQQPTPNAGFNLRVSTIPAGSLMQVSTSGRDRLYVSPGETRPFSLIVQNPIRNDRGEIVVPYGSRVDGRFEPASGGTRFIAESVIVNNQVFPLAAQSDVLRDVKDPRYTSTGKVVQDAAIGAAAGALLGALTGDKVVATEEVLGAGVAGAGIGNLTAPQVVVVDPSQPIDLRLTQDLATSRQS